MRQYIQRKTGNLEGQLLKLAATGFTRQEASSAIVPEVCLATLDLNLAKLIKEERLTFRMEYRVRSSGSGVVRKQVRVYYLPGSRAV